MVSRKLNNFQFVGNYVILSCYTLIEAHCNEKDFITLYIHLGGGKEWNN